MSHEVRDAKRVDVQVSHQIRNQLRKQLRKVIAEKRREAHALATEEVIK
jgi:hypothetical protein